jgi:hypothetical protein
MIAANGMILLHQHLQGITNNSPFLQYATRLLRATIDMSLAPKAKMQMDGTVNMNGYDTILLNSTANNNENAREKSADHGLVYADYYFLEAGNALLSIDESHH